MKLYNLFIRNGSLLQELDLCMKQVRCARISVSDTGNKKSYPVKIPCMNIIVLFTGSPGIIYLLCHGLWSAP